MPKTPSALKVFRSAWMPAPPPESDPAMVRARGLGTSRPTGSTGEVVPTPRPAPRGPSPPAPRARCDLAPRPPPTGQAQTPEILREPVGQVHHRRRSRLGEGLPLADP